MTSKPNSEATLPAEARPAFPLAWINAREAQARLWGSLARAPRSLLICDYDGTLAPFKADKMTAVPFPGVVQRLEKLAALPGVTLALVSGRPVAELLTLLPLAERLELYGSHGREHRSADGAYHLAEAPRAAIRALEQAAEELTRLGHGDALERKAASLAVHWRNLSPARQGALETLARDVFGACIRASNDASMSASSSDPMRDPSSFPMEDRQARSAPSAGLSILSFESGVELRADDQTKAHAVASLLASDAGQGATAAYLGDDTTDEDAFGALGAQGVSLLVRDEPRPSLAGYWLRPPAQLLGFLDDWLLAAARS